MTEVFFSEYPTNWYWKSMESYFENLKYNEQSPIDLEKKRIHNNFLSASSIEEARRSFLWINFYYKDLNYKVVSESPLWSVNSLLSNLGGNLGLFVGISLLSLVEIVEITIQCIMEITSHLNKMTKVNRF